MGRVGLAVDQTGEDGRGGHEAGDSHNAGTAPGSVVQPGDEGRVVGKRAAGREALIGEDDVGPGGGSHVVTVQLVLLCQQNMRVVGVQCQRPAGGPSSGRFGHWVDEGGVQLVPPHWWQCGECW